MDTTLNYWRLRCKILEIPICRKCGIALSGEIKYRSRGKLCWICCLEEYMGY